MRFDKAMLQAVKQLREEGLSQKAIDYAMEMANIRSNKKIIAKAKRTDSKKTAEVQFADVQRNKSKWKGVISIFKRNARDLQECIEILGEKRVDDLLRDSDHKHKSGKYTVTQGHIAELKTVVAAYQSGLVTEDAELVRSAKKKIDIEVGAHGEDRIQVDIKYAKLRNPDTGDVIFDPHEYAKKFEKDLGRGACIWANITELDEKSYVDLIKSVDSLYSSNMDYLARIELLDQNQFERSCNMMEAIRKEQLS